MDITIQYHLDTIRKNKDKKSLKVQESKKFLDKHISGLRFSAFKMRGTTVSTWFNRESNKIEKDLFHAMLT